MYPRIFIGYDERESVAYHTLCQSILEKSSTPVVITPILTSQLSNVLTRPKHPLQTNDFSFSRFLVPFMCRYDGFAIFMDCDMIVDCDINELWNLRSRDFAIQVVKHKHIPVEETKYLNQVQTKYERKNWSSLIIFNNCRCTTLTPKYVNSVNGLDLHQFKWTFDEFIGELPLEWNFLVGYNKIKDSMPKILHYTIGGPWFEKYQDCEFSQNWFHHFKRMINCQEEIENYVFDNIEAMTAEG